MSRIHLLLVVLGVAFASAAEASEPNDGMSSAFAQGDEFRLKEWQDGNAEKAIPVYEEALKAGADEYEVRWRMASAYFWAGENTHDEAKLVVIGKKCIAEAEKAAKLKPDRAEGHYYTAVCWGTYSHGISILKAIGQGVEGTFKAAAGKAEKIDPSFEDGAVLNAWGRFYYELPWPKRDLAKSEKFLKRNIELTPCNLRTRVYYVETILKKGDKVGGKDPKTVAKEQLQYVLDNENCLGNPGDGEHSKKTAKKILQTL